MSDISNKQLVSIAHLQQANYPNPPFNPPTLYPELKQLKIDTSLDPDNEVYARIRDIFESFHFDKQHENTPQWNPLKNFIKPGDRVFIKPNLVFHHHPLGDKGVLSMVTHGSILRPIIDYAWLALKGKGKIIIGDVPLQTANWQTIIEKTGLLELVSFYRKNNMPISLFDLRLERATANRYGVITERKLFSGDPLGYAAVDLGAQSLLTPIIHSHKKFTITDYPEQAVSQHHNPRCNEYLIAKSVLAADVFINVPKLKTHKKAGVTLAMKNLIGINGDKSWIAHHRGGGVTQGGDEYPTIQWFDWLKYRVFVKLKLNPIGVLILNFLLPFLKFVALVQRFISPTRKNIMRLTSITEGSWYGNDTLWRIIIDLNRILLYADKNGILHDTTQRKYLTIIDGVWAGERNGPMHHIPKKTGVIIGGLDAIMTDIVATHLMGFNHHNIPHLAQSFQKMKYPLLKKTPRESLERLLIINLRESTKMKFSDWSQQPTLAFLPPTTWVGHIEHSVRHAIDETSNIPLVLEDAGGE